MWCKNNSVCVFPPVDLQAVADSRGHDEADHGHQSTRSRDEDHLLQGNPFPHLWAHVGLSSTLRTRMLKERCSALTRLTTAQQRRSGRHMDAAGASVCVCLDSNHFYLTIICITWKQWSYKQYPTSQSYRWVFSFLVNCLCVTGNAGPSLWSQRRRLLWSVLFKNCNSYSFTAGLCGV